MEKTWLQIKVELEGGLGVDLDPPPGRTLLAGGSHTFEQLADAINAAFARWDVSHLHEFELADGRRIGFPDDDGELPAGEGWEDHSALRVTDAVGPGDEFVFTFDLGDDWRHRCTVLTGLVDPLEEYGDAPRQPVPVFGWGWIPDQYGRESDEEFE